MSKIIRKTISLFKNSHQKEIDSSLNFKNGDYFVSKKPPYLCQFASRELVSDILDKKVDAKSDPKWASFGFKTKKEYEYWAWRMCGLICVKMVFDTYDVCGDKDIASLTEEASKLGGYVIYNSKGQYIDNGWYYKPLIKFVKKYGLTGKICGHLSISDICTYISHNKFVIASVQPSVIRFDVDTKPKGSNGGHLVLIYGFRFEDDKCTGFYIHNPSGRTKQTQESVFIPITRFEEASASRGFTVFQKTA